MTMCERDIDREREKKNVCMCVGVCMCLVRQCMLDNVPKRKLVGDVVGDNKDTGNDLQEHRQQTQSLARTSAHNVHNLRQLD